jgi:arylsulfatase A-like enzyme
MQRRHFIPAAAAPFLSAQAPERPNILWVTCEDMSPNLGCYGDKFAESPTIDSLAERSLRYRTCWSNAPVCAPARTTIISGMYPPSTGAEHMRSETKLAPGQKMFPQILREAGYYTSNNNKEDYNLVYTGKVWDDSSTKAHFRNRAANQPFFSVFNFVITHESQIRRRPHELKHDPREVRVPAYHPDTPEVRHDWAQYYDNIKAMDFQVKRTLGELAADGLNDSTIVFFYSDHGAGMPRSKRWPYNSGLRVPLMVHIPERFRHLAPKDYQPGGWTNRPISFVDLAPTALGLAGIAKPDYHQGHAFLGAKPGPEPKYVFGFRGRMDERIDMVRSVRNQRYVYIRNYLPHRIYGQHVAYMFEMPTAMKWKELNDAGKLNAAQSHFWKTKPIEELYDLENDPDEVNNLALKPSPEHLKARNELNAQLLAKQLEIKDVGFLPENEIHARAGEDAPYAMARDKKRYDAAAAIDAANTRFQAGKLASPDSAIRFWGVTQLLSADKTVIGAQLPKVRALLKDTSPNVRITAAEVLARFGEPSDEQPAIELLLNEANAVQSNNYIATAALNALTEIGAAKIKPYRAKLEALPRDNEKSVKRAQGYVPRLTEYLLEITK